jgi:hypothetical protein
MADDKHSGTAETGTPQKEPPKTEVTDSLHELLCKMENFEQIKDALMLGLSAIGELERLQSSFALITEMGGSPPLELKPMDVNGTCIPSASRFAEALQYVEFWGPGHEELRAAALA